MIKLMPGKLFIVKKGFVTTIFSDANEIIARPSIKKGGVLMCLKSPYIRDFNKTNGQITLVRVKPVPVSRFKLYHKGPYYLWCSLMLWEDKNIDLTSFRRDVKDYNSFMNRWDSFITPVTKS